METMTMTAPLDYDKPVSYNRIPPELEESVQKFLLRYYPACSWEWIKVDYDTHPHLIATARLRGLVDAFMVGIKSSPMSHGQLEDTKVRLNTIIQLTMNSKQRDKVTEIYYRGDVPPAPSVLDFFTSATPIIGSSNDKGECAWGVIAYGMMHGIEPDGHSHT
jgi:hypothetical protein